MISGQPKISFKVTGHWRGRLLFSFYPDDFSNQHGNAKHDCEFCAGKLFCLQTVMDPGIGNIHIKGKTVAKNKILAYNNYRNELTISGQPKLNLKVTEHWEWRLLFSFYLYDFNNQHGNAKHDCEFFICRNRYHLLIMRFGFFTVNAVITEMANRLPCLNQLMQ